MRSCSCDRLSMYRARAGPFGGSGNCRPTCSCLTWSRSSAIALSSGDRFLCTPTGPAHTGAKNVATKTTERRDRIRIFIGASASTARLGRPATLPPSAWNEERGDFELRLKKKNENQICREQKRASLAAPGGLP